ncbi:unnamed protein product [Rhodiola kirilowii]
MRCFSSSSIHSRKKQKLRLNSILSSTCGANRYENSSCFSSSSAEVRGTDFNYLISNPNEERYLEDIRYRKRQSARGFSPNLISLSRFMNSYSKIGCAGYGFGVLGLILKWGYTPHVIGISSLMNALCNELRINDAALLFQKMKTHLGCTPNIVTYGTLLKGLCSTGNSIIALNLHEQIADGTHDLSCFLQLNVIGYSTLIDGLCKDGLIDKAKELFLEMKKKDISPNVITYTILIGGLCRAGKWEEAQTMFHEMLDQGLSPDIVTYGVLLKGLCSTGNSRIAFNLHEQIADGTHDLSRVLQMNFICYSTLIDGLCKDGLTDKAKELFLEMKKKEISPDVITYNIVIDGLCKAGKWEEAQALFHEMLDHGLEPSVVTFNVLINALAKMGKSKEAKELFLLMIQGGQMPDMVTYNSLMDCIYNEGNIEEVKEFFVSMDKKGVAPNVVSYNILIKGYCKHGMIHEANEEYRQMIQKGVKPNIITVNTLSEGMFLKGMENEAIELKSDFLAKKEDIDDFFVRGASLKAATKILVRQLNHAQKTDNQTYKAVADPRHCHSYTGNCSSVINFCWHKGLILKLGYTPNVIGINILMNALSQQLRINEAVVICKISDTHKKMELLQMMAQRQLKLDDVIDHMVITQLVKEEKYHELASNFSSKGTTNGLLTHCLKCVTVDFQSNRTTNIFEQMWWLSLSSIRRWKNLKMLQHPPILGGSGNHNEMCFSLYLLSNFSVARATVSDQPKSNYTEGYIENIKSHKRNSCRGLLPDLFSLSRLMKSYSKIGCAGYGFGVLGLVLKLGYTPHVIGISSLMNALCKQLRINEAASLFQKMKAHLGCTPNIVTYGTLLKGLCSTGNSRIALNLHEQIADGTHDLSGVLQLDSTCYNTLIDGLCKDGLIDIAMELFLEMKKKEISPDVITYSIVIAGMFRAGKWEEAQAIFHEMLDKGLSPGVFTYGVLLKGLCSSGNSRIALNLHEQIADGTHDLSGVLQLNLICYSTLINGLCKDGLIDKAKELFLEMKKKDISPNVITYTMVIDGLCRAGKWEEAQAMYGEMLHHGLQPSVVTFTVLINALAKMGKGKEARELFLLMIQTGQMPNVVTYTTLMDCIYNEGNIEELKEFFVSMDKKGIMPNVVSYTILIKAYCKHGLIHEANEEYRRMIQKGVKPDIITVNTLSQGMFLKGMESEAIELKSDFLAKKEDIDDCLVRGASLKLNAVTSLHKVTLSNQKQLMILEQNSDEHIDFRDTIKLSSQILIWSTEPVDGYHIVVMVDSELGLASPGRPSS